MKKFLSLAIAIILIASIFVLTGCENKEVEEPEEEQIEETEVVEEYVEKVPTVIDRSNSKLQDEEDVKDEIESATQSYFKMLYGDRIKDAKIGDIMIYKGDEEEMKYVDLAENDYAFQIDYEIKPTDESFIEELTEYFGEYDKESGWIVNNHGYGVMRYNKDADEFDVTSITPDGF